MKSKNVLILLPFFLVTLGIGCADSSELGVSQDKPAALSKIAPSSDEKCPLLSAILESRDPQSYTKELNEALAAITLNPGTLPVGSFKFRAQKFPGDIDIFEASEVNMPKEQAKKYFSQRLANVAERVATDPDLLLADFKAGKDAKMQIDVGKVASHRIYTGYNYRSVLNALNKLNEDNLLSEEEYRNLMGLVKENPTFDEWANMKENVRQLSTLRWSIEELMAQSKILRDGTSLSLSDALDGTVVKIDIFAPVTSTEGYTEVTNFYNLKYTDKGQTHSLTEPMANYAESITKDVVTFFDKNTRKLLKAAKRLWVLSTIYKDNELTAKLIPITQSHAAALNQIIAESEVVRALASSQGSIECAVMGPRIMKQIQSFEKRILENTTEISLDALSNPHSGLVKKIFESYREDCPLETPYENAGAVSERTKSLMVDNLNALEDMIKPIVEKLALAYLTKVGVDVDNPLKSLTGHTDVCPYLLPKLDE